MRTHAFECKTLDNTRRWGVADILLALRRRLGLPLLSRKAFGFGLYE